MTPFEPYPTADRDIVIGLGSDKDWPHFCEVIGYRALLDDPRFHGDEARLDNRDALDDVLGAHLKQHSSTHWLELLVDNGIPCSLVENVQTIAESPVSDEYAAFSTVAAQEYDMRFVRNPIADRGLKESPAPELGQHTSEILQELGYDRSAIAALTG